MKEQGLLFSKHLFGGLQPGELQLPFKAKVEEETTPVSIFSSLEEKWPPGMVSKEVL